MATVKSRKYEKALRVRDSSLQEYSFEIIKEKILEYQRAKAPSLKNQCVIYEIQQKY